MPDSVRFPGVFIEEIPGGVKPIEGVATDITAFVGRTVRGPIEPRDCFGFADFERDFGGRASGYPLVSVREQVESSESFVIQM